MMKWKVTKNQRCASADRSTDYLRKVDELPDPTLFRSPLGNQQYEKEPLMENRKLTQQGNELFRKSSFAATDCINLKGIFGISKDRNETAYSSLGLINGVDRQRSRSEVRGASADRFSVAYHCNPPLVPQIPIRVNGKDKAKDSKVRSTSPVDKNKICWVRGRRREREIRKPLPDEDNSKVRTVVTGTRTPTPGKKMINSKTKIDSSETRNKPKGKKNGRSVSKEKGNFTRGKENKEIKNDGDNGGSKNVQTEVKTVGGLTQCPPSVVKPKRNTRKKGLAPKPQPIQLKKENPKNSDISTKVAEPSRDEANRFQTAVNKSGILGSASDLSEDMVTNIKCNGIPLTNEHENENQNEHVNETITDTHIETMTVQAEIHFSESKKDMLLNFTEKETKCEISNRETNVNANKRKLKLETKFQEHNKSGAITPNPKTSILPIIDEPDYTPSNSDSETGKSAEISENISTTESSENTNDQFRDYNKSVAESIQEMMNTEDDENMSEHSGKEDPKEETEEILTCEQLIIDISNTTTNKNMQVEMEHKGGELTSQRSDTTEDITEAEEISLEEDIKEIENTCEVLMNEDCGASSDDATDTTDLDDSTLLNMSSDTLGGISVKSDDPIPTSPTSPPRKKMMASLLEQQLQQQLMTVNVVVRNPPPSNGTNISLATPIINDVPKECAVKKKKSFVLTVAKQEEGFRSLCASRDFLSNEGYTEPMETDRGDERISVTFLCSGPPSESWINNSPLVNNNRLRSISVPPKNGKTQTEFVSLIQAASQRSNSKDRRAKDKQGSKRKSHKSRKKDSLFNMPQAVIDELSQVLETRKRVPDDGAS